MAGNILIATAILWILSAIFVTPLSQCWLKRRLQQPAYAHLQAESLSEEDQAALSQLGTECFIATDVLVLGVAGFIGGLLGYWFFGVSLNAKGWPGIIAFVASSLVASNLVA